MKLVTVWFTEDEKAFLDELAKTEDVTLSRALRDPVGRSYRAAVEGRPDYSVGPT